MFLDPHRLLASLLFLAVTMPEALNESMVLLSEAVAVLLELSVKDAVLPPVTLTVLPDEPPREAELPPVAVTWFFELTSTFTVLRPLAVTVLSEAGPTNPPVQA